MEKSKSYVSEGGTTFWYSPSKGKGYLHRLDGPAVEGISGHKEWMVNNKLHRLGGPALEYVDGSKCWYVDDARHRLDGPAVEWHTGTKEWWIDGKQLLTEEVETWLEENNIKLKTKVGQLAFKLRWS